MELPGLLPPQALALEEAVLGAMLLEREVVSIISDILKPQSFYNIANETIYSTILSLFNRSYPTDILTVTQELKKNNEIDKVGGAYYVTQLTNRVASAASAEFHARIILQKYIQRELIRISNETIRSAYSEATDCFDLLDSHEKQLTSLTRNFSSKKAKSMSTYWREILARNTLLLTKKGLSGIPAGYPEIDAITGGWQNSDLIIIAARPAMGKTSLACNFARNAAVDFKKPGVIFSLEMEGLQLAQRIFSMESETPNSLFMRRGIEEDKMPAIEEICLRLINSGLHIDDSEGLTLLEFRSRLRKYIRDYEIEWALIDYLQLMNGAKDASVKVREQVISEITRGLKSCAKELGIPIIALSQLSRAVETRGGNKKPQLSDLRESGAIEQDADIVMFIHRPEYYGLLEYEDGSSTAGVAEIIFAKHRNGALDEPQLNFIHEFTKFKSRQNAGNMPDFIEQKQSEFLANTSFLNSGDEYGI